MTFRGDLQGIPATNMSAAPLTVLNMDDGVELSFEIPTLPKLDFTCAQREEGRRIHLV